MQKVVIIGSCGSGKTTLARRLASLTDIPMTDLDDLYWNPNWQPSDKQAFIKDICNVTKESKWIISGNYRKVAKDFIWPKADTLIWIDYSFFRTFYQLSHRTFRRIIDKKEICNGNIETLSQLLSERSIILWYLQTYKSRKEECMNLFSSKLYDNIHAYIRLSNPKETETFVSNL